MNWKEDRELEKARKKAKEVEKIIRKYKHEGYAVKAYPWKDIFKRIYKKSATWYIAYELDYDVLSFLSKDTLIFIRDTLRDMLIFMRDHYPKLPGVSIDENTWYILPLTEPDRTRQLYYDVHKLNSIIAERTKREMEKYRGE